MNRAQPDLSVVILSFNTRQITLDCVGSVFADAANTALQIEVIVVDNASADGTAAAAQLVHPHTKLVELHENMGFSRGNNAGFTLARGRYLLALNSDTLVQANALQELVSFMDAHPDAGICGPMLLNENLTLQPSGRQLPTVASLFIDMTRLYRFTRNTVFAEHARDYAEVRRVGEVSGAALLIRKTLYDRIGGFDERIFAYYEDVDLCKRCHDAGFAVYYVPQAKVVHLWKRSSRAVPELVLQTAQDSTRYYFRKHHGWLAQAFVQGLLASKEAIFVVATSLRRDKAETNLHKRLLKRALNPLP